MRRDPVPVIAESPLMFTFLLIVQTIIAAALVAYFIGCPFPRNERS